MRVGADPKLAKMLGVTSPTDAERVLAARLAAQRLSGPPAAGPLEVVRSLLAVQAQDARAARLAVRVRSADGYSSDVDRALSEERSLIITWVNRGTLHLLAAEDEPWLHALTAPRLRTANDRRLHQEGVSQTAAERGVTAITAALADHGPLTRAELRAAVERADVPTAGQALVHVLPRATLDGFIVRGPIIDGEHAFVLVTDWLGSRPPVERGRALAELARRYLTGHSPADDRDLARWAGLSLRDARAGLQAIAHQLHQRPDGLLELNREPPPPIPPPRLLGPFDPLPPRLALSRLRPSRPSRSGHQQWHLPCDRPHRRPRRWDVGHASRSRPAQPLGCRRADRRLRARSRRRRRRALPLTARLNQRARPLAADPPDDNRRASIRMPYRANPETAVDRATTVTAEFANGGVAASKDQRTRTRSTRSASPARGGHRVWLASEPQPHVASVQPGPIPVGLDADDPKPMALKETAAALAGVQHYL